MGTAGAKKLFWSKKVFLFDLDGTLYLGKKILPGARELLWKLSDENKIFYYLTNNSSRSQGDYVKKLLKMGFPVTAQQVVMSTHLLISQLKNKKWKKVFLLGTPAMRKMLSASGIQHSAKGPKAVVVGFDKTITYKKLESAVRFVEAGIPYIVTHPDLYCPTENGPEPDCGAFAKVIELVTQKAPLMVLGKPHPLMLREVTKRQAAQKEDMLLIGDRLTTDIAMARAYGIDSILVLTGETTRRDLKFLRGKSPDIISSVKNLL